MKITLKSVSLRVEMDKDEGVRYYHPLTNQACECPEQCFHGWSEQDESDNQEWTELLELIQSGACDEHIRDDVDYNA